MLGSWSTHNMSRPSEHLAESNVEQRNQVNVDESRLHQGYILGTHLFESSLAGQTPHPQGQESGQIPIYTEFVSNTPRIFLRVDWFG